VAEPLSDSQDVRQPEPQAPDETSSSQAEGIEEPPREREYDQEEGEQVGEQRTLREDYSAPEHQTPRREQGRADFQRRERRPAEPQAVAKAIEQVNEIIETLRETLDEMEGVLETLELAERQKNADEREIDTLSRSLQRLQRPREDRGSFRSGQAQHHQQHHR
jgi:hypothetical protein